MIGTTAGLLLILWLIFAGIAALIGQHKNLPIGESFTWGLLFGAMKASRQRSSR